MSTDVRLAVGGSHVISETIDGETVVINLDSGVYFSLGGTASDVWEAAVEGTALSDLLADLHARYDGEEPAIRGAVEGLLAEMEADGLVRRVPRGPSDNPAGPEPAPNGERRPFAPPTLERFTDIQDLLLLDPIHEVDDRGWPNPRSGE